MKIVFWSREEDCLSLSAAVCAVACTSALDFRHKSIVFHSGFKCNGLNHAFKEQADVLMLKEELSYLCDSGIDLILNRLHFKENVPVTLDLCRKGDLIYYLEGSRRANRDIYEEMFEENAKDAFGLLEKMSEVLFIACGGEINSKVNRLVIDEADLLVVLCGQIPAYNAEVIREVSAIEKKKMFLAGMYDKSSKYAVKNIQRDVHAQKDSIGVIPYNIAFQDSLTDGSAVAFMERAVKSTKNDNLNSFFKEIRNTTRKILWKAGFYEEMEKKRKMQNQG